jgi:hypothetical protein
MGYGSQADGRSKDAITASNFFALQSAAHCAETEAIVCAEAFAQGAIQDKMAMR